MADRVYRLRHNYRTRPNRVLPIPPVQPPAPPPVVIEPGYYDGLLTSEYAQSTRLHQHLGALLSSLTDVDGLVAMLDNAFDIDQAVGVQLDILGQIVGQSRTLNFQPNYGVSPVLIDDDYRILLKACIGRNHWDGQQTSLSGLWQRLFPNARLGIHDNHFMDMDVFVDNLKPLFVDLIRHGLIVPKPEAVRINTYFGGPLPWFGFDYDDPYVSGCDRGHWWTPSLNLYPGLGFDEDDDMIGGFDHGNWWVVLPA